MNKQNTNRIIDTKHFLMVARCKRVGGTGEKCAGIKKYKLVVTE